MQVLAAIELAVVSPEERDQMKECFCVYGAETMAVAGKDQTVLWTDDSTLGILATSTFGAKRTWTQIVLLSFVEAGVLSRDDYNKAVARLIGWNYKLTFFDSACMLEACRLSEFGAARFPLKQMIEVFREIVMPNGMLIRLFLEFFVALQREPLLFQKKSLIGWPLPRSPLGKSCISRSGPRATFDELKTLRTECGCRSRVQWNVRRVAPISQP